MLGASSAPLEWIVDCLLVAFWLPPGHVAHNMQTNEIDLISSSLNFTCEGFGKTTNEYRNVFLVFLTSIAPDEIDSGNL